MSSPFKRIQICEGVWKTGEPREPLTAAGNAWAKHKALPTQDIGIPIRYKNAAAVVTDIERDRRTEHKGFFE